MVCSRSYLNSALSSPPTALLRFRHPPPHLRPLTGQERPQPSVRTTWPASSSPNRSPVHSPSSLGPPPSQLPHHPSPWAAFRQQDHASDPQAFWHRWSTGQWVSKSQVLRPTPWSTAFLPCQSSPVPVKGQIGACMRRQGSKRVK